MDFQIIRICFIAQLVLVTETCVIAHFAQKGKTSRMAIPVSGWNGWKHLFVLGILGDGDHKWMLEFNLNLINPVILVGETQE